MHDTECRHMTRVAKPRKWMGHHWIDLHRVLFIASMPFGGVSQGNSLPEGGHSALRPRRVSRRGPWLHAPRCRRKMPATKT